MVVLYRLQLTIIISSLLHRLLYAFLQIFREVSPYLYDFQRITTHYY